MKISIKYSQIDNFSTVFQRSEWVCERGITHETNCPFLDRIQQFQGMFGCCTPNMGTVFQDRSDLCLIDHKQLTGSEIAPGPKQKTKFLRCTFSNWSHVIFPGKVFADSNTKHRDGCLQRYGYSWQAHVGHSEIGFSREKACLCFVSLKFTKLLDPLLLLLLLRSTGGRVNPLHVGHLIRAHCAPTCYNIQLGMPTALEKFSSFLSWISFTSSGLKIMLPRTAFLWCVSAGHSVRTCDDVSSSSRHHLQRGSSLIPISSRCLLRWLCPVRSPTTVLRFRLFRNKNLFCEPLRRFLYVELRLSHS